MINGKRVVLIICVVIFVMLYVMGALFIEKSVKTFIEVTDSGNHITALLVQTSFALNVSGKHYFLTFVVIIILVSIRETFFLKNPSLILFLQSAQLFIFTIIIGFMFISSFLPLVQPMSPLSK